MSIRRIAPTLAVAAALLGAATSVAQTKGGTVHEVEQIGLEFVPSNITIDGGDTVRWIWSGGDHTVTSGIICGPDGRFSHQLTADNPIVEIEFVAGIVCDYYCSPHCSAGMLGRVTVIGCTGDIDGDGDVNFEDLLAVLTDWGCPFCPATDLNGDSTVDFEDLLILLSNWGPCR